MNKSFRLQVLLGQELEKVLWRQKRLKLSDCMIINKVLDARRANQGRTPRYEYTLVALSDYVSESLSFPKINNLHEHKKVVIIGAGPAGLFAAKRLTEYGLRPILIERGEGSRERMLSISKYWRKGVLNPESNVCFGEGGAGLFSDGKLITRVKSPHISYVMNRFVDYGADPEVAYLANPHLGSNKIRNIITQMTHDLTQRGVKILLNERVDKILISDDHKSIRGVQTNKRILECDFVVLAMGHSAHDMFYHLKDDLKLDLESKDFAVGVRIEHPRRLIDQLQYGEFAGTLDTAFYRLSYHDHKTQRGTYSFCMCPGGHVLSTSTDADGLVTNGMSNSRRMAPYTNSGLVVSVRRGGDFAADDALAGLKFQREIEKKAYDFSKKHATGRELPAQRMLDFMQDKKSPSELNKNSVPSQLVSCRLADILPSFVVEHLKSAFLAFDKQLKGFLTNDALLIAPETRTSSPLRIPRNKETLMSDQLYGLYPCAEGAGYAGGITSAAVDGVKVADQIAKLVMS